MANRIVEQLNNIKSNAPYIGAFYSKSYLRRTNDTQAPLNTQRAYENAINMYFRIGGFDQYETQEANFSKMTDLTGQIMNALEARMRPFSFTLHGKGKNMEAFYGTHYECADIIRNACIQNVYNISLENMWIQQGELERLQRYNSAIVGVRAFSAGTIDTVINSLSGTDYLINFLCLPYSKQEIATEINRVNTVLGDLQRVKDFELSFGTGRQRRYSTENLDVTDAIHIVEQEKIRLQNALASGGWKVLVHIGAETKENEKIVVATLAAAFSSSKYIESQDSKSTIYTTIDFPAVSRSVWEYPISFLGTFDFGGLYSSSLLNVVDSDCLRSVVALPLGAHGEYNVRMMGGTSGEAGAFSSQPPIPKGERILNLGFMPNGMKYQFSIDDFRQHAFVTGAPRYGKSTSVQKIITEAYHLGIPFIVVEAAKKEYWQLKQIKGVEGIRVCSAGRDTAFLQINPFQPEYNTPLDFHIQSLIHAFLSMFDQEDPLPQILTELIYTCYTAHGWDTNERVRDVSDLEYPSFDDMLLYLDEVIESIGYDPEIKDRMRGVVKIRIQALIRQAGKSLNTKNNMTAEELFRTSAVIELDDFAEQLKPFVASVIALKINEYTRQCKMSGNMKRLLVLEEAHHILPNPESRSASRNAAKCAAYFTNMLSEVSAYGTGIIVVDQRASTIAPAAIANTSVKIIHNTHEGADMDTIMSCLNLREQARAHLNTLHIGQAIVSFPLTDRICMVEIDGYKEKNAGRHLGCLFCKKENCTKESFDFSSYEINLLSGNGISGRTLQRCVESYIDRTARRLTSEERICFAGQLCQRVCTEEDNPILIRQHLYDFYSSLNK